MISKSPAESWRRGKECGGMATVIRARENVAKGMGVVKFSAAEVRGLMPAFWKNMDLGGAERPKRASRVGVSSDISCTRTVWINSIDAHNDFEQDWTVFVEQGVLVKADEYRIRQPLH